MRPDSKERITGLVLAGGASRRMQEHAADKGLLMLGDKPLVAHALERLLPQVDSIAISANNNIPTYEALGVPVWQDMKDADWEEFPGPLAGVLTGLNHCTTQWLVTVPCDSPLLPDYMVNRLFESAIKAQAKIAIACTQNGQDGQEIKDHPVFALIHHTLKDDLHRYLRGGDRKILYWMRQHAFERVLFDDHKAFMANINTVADLADLYKLTKADNSL